jgi:DNA-binding FrmR family transcriptional regulator
MPKGIPRDNSINKKILHRLSIAQGQLAKVITMVRNDDYCIDVINQSLAVQSALKKTDQVIMKNHLTTCALDAAKKGHMETIIKEVITVMDKHDCCSGKCTCKDCQCTCKECCCKKEEKESK